MSIESDIIDAAFKMGFAAAGIAAAGPAESLNIFKPWVANGYAADMKYLSNHLDLRSDPRKLAPGIQSIIAVAARYPVNPNPGLGFSTYARGTDYHLVLRTKLRELLAFLRSKAPIHAARICVDSAPLLEREWAIRAGIGWQGRQGQIVNPSAGCCLVLGFLLLDVPLAASPQIPVQCGECRLCVEACPTRAICPNGRVDARRCISCLTIEQTGTIPDKVASAMQESLFGCDFCTAICPWNRFGNDRIMPELADRDRSPSPPECLNMTEKEFAALFRDTAVYRTGLARLKRNAEIAIRNRARE